LRAGYKNHRFLYPFKVLLCFLTHQADFELINVNLSASKTTGEEISFEYLLNNPACVDAVV